MPAIRNGLLTPPPSPPQTQQPQPWCLPAPQSRIGNILGKSLELVGIIGTGAYGIVYEAFDRQTGISYAVKALNKFQANGEPLDRRQREYQAREIQLHYAASAHPNIVSMFKIVDDPDCTYVVLENCPDGDLFSNITEKGRYVGTDEPARTAFLQLLDAVEHCHRLGIYHRDLKPENILVSSYGNNLLLADFGLATTEPQSEEHGCGSTFYMSPECLNPSSRDAAYLCAPNDIWSLGVILVNLTCGRNPWKQASLEDSTYRAFTRNRDFLKTILPLSDELNNILGRIFDPTPETRITIGELKECIARCSTFAGPAEQTAPALPTPPQSPRTCTSDCLRRSFTSQDGSVLSDEGSLTGSCSTLSDSNISDDDLSDTEDTVLVSMDQELDANDEGYFSSAEQEHCQQVPAKRLIIPEPFQNQAPQYALQQQDYWNQPSPTQWNGYPWSPYGHVPAVSYYQPIARGCASPSYPFCY